MNRKTIPPKIEWIKQYATEQGYLIDHEAFFDYHEAGGWFRGKTKIKDWQAAVRTWARNQRRWNAEKTGSVQTYVEPEYRREKIVKSDRNVAMGQLKLVRGALK